jgi:hypothetical protein
MNISKGVVERLEELANKQPEPVVIDPATSRKGYHVKVPVQEHNLTILLILEDYDRYSAALRYVEISQDSLAQGEEVADDYLHRRAKEAIERLTYLEEPVTLVELDGDAGLAQVRSQPPEHRDEAVIYWELEIWSRPHPRLKLTRYRWTPGQVGRELVVHPVAFARLGRMAEDLALSLANVAP